VVVLGLVVAGPLPRVVEVVDAVDDGVLVVLAVLDVLEELESDGRRRSSGGFGKSSTSRPFTAAVM
jgi:hypothetical protein